MHPPVPETSSPCARRQAEPVERLSYRISDATQALRVSRSTINKWIALKKIRTIAIGRRRLIPASEIERILREGLR